MYEQTLKQERDRFVAFAFASADVLAELGRDGGIYFIDGATLGLLGRKHEELEGGSFLDLVHERDRHTVAQMVEHFAKLHRVEKLPVTLVRKDGGTCLAELSAFKVGIHNDHIYLSISAVRDEATNRELLRRDLVSGLLKKESFITDANHRIREATEKGKDVTLTLLDFSTLKDLLDQLPADQAAHLLAEISEYLRSRSIGGDTAGMIEEGAFSVVHDASVSSDQIIHGLMDITKRMDPKGKGAKPRATSIDTKTKDLTEQDTANALLYTINTFARQRGEAFSIHSLADSYKEMLEDTVEKISHFKETVAADKFQIAFQPIVDIKSSIIHHYECLVRLQDNKTFENPFHFISFGEQAGVINEFDLAMLQKTLDTLEIAAKKKHFPNVAVNVSGKSLSSSLFMDAYAELLARHPNLRRQVIVEITESSKIDNVEGANKFVQHLRNLGNSFCLDDFGTGESSFDYLRSLQVDYIKIDGSYVRESIKTQRGRQMLKAMAGLCNSLDVVTIGEMVEDEKAARILWECGIKFGQGYLFGKPDVDPETLTNCAKPTPYFKGFMKARKISDTTKKLWGT